MPNSKSRLKRLSALGAPLCSGCGGKMGNPQPAMARFVENEPVGAPPLERLRHFCSLAMSPQDWLDVESLFDACEPADPQPEPVFWQWRANKDAEWALHSYPVIATTPESEVRCLYAAPQAQQPLTDEQLLKVLDSFKPHEKVTAWLPTPICFVRAIEAAHGIGKK